MDRSRPLAGVVFYLAFLAGVLLFLPSHYVRAEGRIVGHIVFAKGQVAAQTGNTAGALPRILGTNSDLYETDVIQTGLDSFAVIEFIDRARMTVRPDTQFSIEKYTLEGQTETRLNLSKGGFQTTPGEIAEQHPAQVQVQTPLATVKPGNSGYMARLCGEQDCETDKPLDDSSAIARVIALEGGVFASNGTGERVLQLGSSVFVEDRIKTLENSYTVLLFRDSGKITIDSDSQFLISEYHYDAARNDNKSVVNLLSGGIRALTGAIGKDNHKNYQVITPVATIGIRGTGFDLHCLESCINTGTGRNSIPSAQQPVAGLYSYVWKDSITLTNAAGHYELQENRASYIASPNSLPVAIPQLPDIFMNIPAPRPDSIKLNATGTADKTMYKGLYVKVDNRNGNIQIKTREGHIHTITAGTSGYVDPRGDIRLTSLQNREPPPDNLPVPDTTLPALESGYAAWTGTARQPPGGPNDDMNCEVQ